MAVEADSTVVAFPREAPPFDPERGARLDRSQPTPDGVVRLYHPAPASRLHEVTPTLLIIAAIAHGMKQIRAITVDVSTSNLEKREIRAFVSVERQGERTYTSTVHALSDQELRRQVLEKAWADLEAWRERHRELTEFARVFAAIDASRTVVSPSQG